MLIRSTAHPGLKKIFAPANDEPISGGVLDQDFYKFPMGQYYFLRPRLGKAIGKFKLTIRTKGVPYTKIVPIEALREQLDVIMQERCGDSELAYLRGMQLGRRPFFMSEYLDFFSTLRLPTYHLEYQGNKVVLEFEGPLDTVTYWEVKALFVLNELYYFYLILSEKLSKTEVTALYSAMLVKLQERLNIVKTRFQLYFSEFGTRRRLSRYHQGTVNDFLYEQMGENFVGTSNVMFAMEYKSANPKGTKAHELPMADSALTENDTDEEIRQSQYDLELDWMDVYPELGILLPDTFGTTQFLRHAPEAIARRHTGLRHDSKDPRIAIPEYLTWLRRWKIDPKTRLSIPSDGLDAPLMVDLYDRHHDDIPMSDGWGTFLTNGCDGIWPRAGENWFRPLSIVIKLSAVKRTPSDPWIPAVKLSDNPSKATSDDPARVDRFKRIFGIVGMQDHAVLV